MSTKTIKNGTEWTVREGYEEILDRFDPEDLLADLNGKRYTLVKENKVRAVISLPESDINENETRKNIGKIMIKAIPITIM